MIKSGDFQFFSLNSDAIVAECNAKAAAYFGVLATQSLTNLEAFTTSGSKPNKG